MTIIEFLEERISEDEAAANNVTVFRMNPATGFPGNQSIKARVLAECAAKRKIIEQVSDVMWGGYAVRDVILEYLAAVYKDHPDYEQEWGLG